MDASLKETKYDVLLVGTGMVEAILAGALARIGKRVLHLDQNDYYGSNYASFSLAQFLRWTKNETITPRPLSDEETIDHTPNATVDNSTHRFLPMQYSFECHLLEEKFRSIDVKETLLQKSSSFSMDVNPRLLLASEQVVETLITSGVGRYLEFAAIERTYVHLPSVDKIQTKSSGNLDTVWHVPCSKKDVFQSKLLQMGEKRQLMKFLQFVADYGDTHILHADVKTKNERSLALGRALPRPQNKTSAATNTVAIATLFNEPFHKVLHEYFHLSEKLQHVIVYCVGLATLPATTTQFSGRQGLAAVYRYVTSIGRFATTAFLAPLYGISELAQSFCRLSAVYGGLYVLRAPIDAFVLNTVTHDLSGVRCTDGSVLRATHVVVNRSYLDCLNLTQTATPQRCGDVLRGVFILDASLRQGVTRLMLVIPPDDTEFHNPCAIQMVQLDHNAFACPEGYYLVQLAMPLPLPWQQQKERQLTLMQNVIRRLILSSEAEKRKEDGEEVDFDWNDRVAWRAIFTMDHFIAEDTSLSTDVHLPTNAWVCETKVKGANEIFPLEMHLESASANARAIFEALCPGADFLPKSASAEQAELGEQEGEEDAVLRAAQKLVHETFIDGNSAQEGSSGTD